MSAVYVFSQLNLGSAHHQTKLTGELNPNLDHLSRLDLGVHCQHVVAHLRDILTQELEATLSAPHPPKVVRNRHHTSLHSLRCCRHTVRVEMSVGMSNQGWSSQFELLTTDVAGDF